MFNGARAFACRDFLAGIGGEPTIIAIILRGLFEVVRNQDERLRDMCGRYTLATSQQQLAEEFEACGIDDFGSRYNIAPTQLAPVVREAAESCVREFAMCKWGLVPHWARDPTIGNRMINARAETAADKPSFRTALRRHRCLVPATGFFEWKVLDRSAKKPVKQPYCIHRRDGRVFAFAGLWERWRSPDGEGFDSFTILTTEPNELMRELHDRMPVIIGREDYGLWLDSKVQDVERITPLLRPCAAENLTAHAVSTRINNPGNDDPSCIEVDS